MHQKVNVLIYLNMLKNDTFEKKSSLTIFSPFFISLVFTFKFNNHDRNEGEEEEDLYLTLRVIHVLIYVCEACCGHSRIAFARKVGKVYHFELCL